MIKSLSIGKLIDFCKWDLAIKEKVDVFSLGNIQCEEEATRSNASECQHLLDREALVEFWVTGGSVL